MILLDTRNRERSVAEVLQGMRSPPGPLGDWREDESLLERLTMAEQPSPAEAK
jgi:hypothetical protein